MIYEGRVLNDEAIKQDIKASAYNSQMAIKKLWEVVQVEFERIHLRNIDFIEKIKEEDLNTEEREELEILETNLKRIGRIYNMIEKAHKEAGKPVDVRQFQEGLTINEIIAKIEEWKTIDDLSAEEWEELEDMELYYKELKRLLTEAKPGQPVPIPDIEELKRIRSSCTGATERKQAIM